MRYYWYIQKNIDRNSSFTPITKASLKKKTININQLLVFWTLVAKELGRRVLASRNIQADLRTLLSAGVVSIHGSHIWLRDITRCWLPSELLSCLCSQQMIGFPYGVLDIYGVFAPLSMFAPLLLKRVEQPRNMFHSAVNSSSVVRCVHHWCQKQSSEGPNIETVHLAAQIVLGNTILWVYWYS